MLFDASTAPQLKPWLVRTLEPICDAEPGALADYILALLKHNVPESDMRKELSAQLDEFLEKECSSFIGTLFTALRTKSYIPYDSDVTPKQPRGVDSGIPIPLDGLISPAISDSPERGLKRSMEYDERDGRPTKGPRLSNDSQFGGYPNGQWGVMNGMNMSHMGMNGNMGQMNGRRPQGYQPPDPKRGLCRDYHNNGYCARGALCKYSHGEEAVIPGQLFPMNGQPMPGVGAQMPFMNMFPNSGMPFAMSGGAYDPHEAQMDMRPLQQGPGSMGLGIGGAGGVGGRSRAPILPRVQQEGGIGSQVIHPRNTSGELPVIQDLTPDAPKEESQPQSQPQPQSPPQLQPQPYPHPHPHPIPHSHLQNVVGDGYGIVDAALGMHMEIDDSGGPINSQGGFRGGMHGGGRGRGINYTGPDHHMRPQKGRNDKTLVVEKIPEDKLSLDAVNGWFKRFGTVTNVAIDARSAKALVTFSEHEEAHRAWKSEDAVFNNRFVKLFWHRPMEGHGQGGARALAASANLVANINGKDQNMAPPSAAASQPATLSVPTTSISGARRKSSTPSAAASALAAKQLLLEQQIAEQKSLMSQLGTASADEKKQIMVRLRKLGEEMKPVASPAVVSTPLPPTALTSQRRASSIPGPDEHERRERERLDKELEGHTAAHEAERPGEENTEDLKAKLARLKAEAASLGLPEATSSYNSTYRPYRGRARATRSYYRGATMRGGPPRASMKLDNRPKILLIKGATGDSVQAVRDWYESTGQVDSVTPLDGGDTLVSFKTRGAAEQGLAKGQNIPQVGQVQISWYTGQPPAVITKDKVITSTAVSSKDNKSAEEVMHPSNGIERHLSPHPQEEEVVASGWGGDGDEDGMGML